MVIDITETYRMMMKMMMMMMMKMMMMNLMITPPILNLQPQDFAW